MTSAPDGYQFIVEPVATPGLDTPDIAAALAAHHTLIEVTVAKTPHLAAFLAADQAFREAANETTALHPIHVDDCQPVDCRYVNLVARSFADTGITADSIRELVDLITSAIDARWWDCLGFNVSPGADKDQLQRILDEALQEAMLMLWWLFNTTSLQGDDSKQATGFERVAMFMDHANNIAQNVATLSRDFPLVNVAAELQAQGWRFNIYRLIMSLLGYKPTPEH